MFVISVIGEDKIIFISIQDYQEKWRPDKLVFQVIWNKLALNDEWTLINLELL